MKIISFLTIGVGAAFFSAAIVNGAAAEPALKTLSGHVPAVVAHLQAGGRLPAANTLNLAIGLPLRNQEALTNLLQDIYDPSSPNYRHFLSPAEFTAQFGPSVEDYQKVVDFAKTNGLTVTRTHGNRMLVDVSGNVSDIEKTFHVQLRTYQHPTEKRQFFAPDTEPSVSANVPVLHVSGLDNYALPRSGARQKPASHATPAIGLGSGFFGGYMGSDFRNAYVPGTALTGAGQTVGLLQFDSGFFQTDITAYETQAGLPNVPVVPVLLDGYDGGPGFDNGEVSLDIEMVMSMAPGVSKILVFEGEVTDDILNAMAASNQVKQLSASWSYPIDPTTEQIYQQFAAQGQTFFNCSQDFDAWVGPIFTPCDDPYVTIVGGTTLTTAVTNGPWSSETVWNWGTEYGLDGIGSSGGISTTYAIPSWQTNISMTLNLGSTTKRNTPDVALTADNIYVVFGGGAQSLFGGTSAATPLWAGYMALVNQRAYSTGHTNGLGFINPAIYTLAKSANYTNYFHDITTGNNTWSGSPNLFYAVTNYDLCTGWGTPNGTNLINALAGAAPIHISAPAQPYGSTLSALKGGNPNGSWYLFVIDDAALETGTNYNGWSITLTSANPVGYYSDLELTMAASASSITVGSNVVISLQVTNYGPSAATNITVLDSLPSGVTLVGTNFTLGSVSSSSSVLQWSIGTLATNAGSQLTLTFQASTSGTLTNIAVVSTSGNDPNPDNNSTGVGVAVGGGSVAIPQLSGNYVRSSGAFVLTILNPTPSQSYVIQASTNMVNWVNVITSTAPNNYTDMKASNYPTRFYRVLPVQPSP